MSNFNLESFNSLFNDFKLIEKENTSEGLGFSKKSENLFVYKSIELNNCIIPFIIKKDCKTVKKFNFNFSSKIQKLIEKKFHIKPKTIYFKYLEIYYEWNGIN